MKKRFLIVMVITFIMACLLPGSAAFAVTFGFNTEESEAEANNTISETNSGYTLQISSSSSEDYVTNWTITAGVWPSGALLMDGNAVYVAYLDPSTLANLKPHGTITVSMAGGKVFSLDSLVCGNGGVADNLAITTGSTTETFPVEGSSDAMITPSSAFQGITSFTLSWSNNDHEMYFDNFNISLSPVITSQPSTASVANGGNTSFSVAATGNTLTYQWQVDTSGSGSSFSNVSDSGAYSGATTASLGITGATAGMNHYLYRCIVTNDGTYPATSNSAALTILGQAPADIALDNASIPEDTASGTKVGGLTTTDPDSSSFTYSLVDPVTYPDNADFTIAGSDLRLNMIPNFESKSNYSIRIRTQDDTALTYDKTFTISITGVNEAPTDIALSNSSIAENSASGTTIGTLSGADPDLPIDVLTYSLPEGMGDNADFTLSDNTLKLNMVPEYEVKNSYSVTARVSDGSLHYDKAFTISITNVNETPTGISLNSTCVLEHSPVGTEAGTLSGTDPDAGSTFTFALVAGEGSTDNSCFTIAGSKLLLNTKPDFEAKSSYSIRVRVTDEGSLYYEQEFTITVLDGNDPPTDISITGGSIAENSVPGTSAGSLTSIDNVGDTFTYTLVAGDGDTDNASFSITDDVLAMDVSADYEAKNSYSVRIRSMDNHGLYFEKALTVSISNVNEAPIDMALSSNTIAENSAIGTTIGTLAGIDPDIGTTFTFSLTAGFGDNACFTISGNSLKLAVVSDFESKDAYSIKIRESDGALTFDKVFTINIADANDAPTDIMLSSSSVLEHCAVGTAVGTLTSDDQDSGIFTYSLIAGDGSTDNARFSITGNTLQISVSPDFEVKNSYSIRIRTTDSTGMYYEEVFTINVLDGDDPPSNISLSNQSIEENSSDGTVIGTLSTADNSGAGPFTYTFAVGSGDTDIALFTIEEDALKIAFIPNYEVKNSYSIRIRTTNEVTHYYYEKVFTITITDVNEAPTNISLSGTSIAEHISSGTTVAAISGIDPDAGSTFTYALAAGTGDTDNASFTILDNELKLAEVPDYEVKSAYNIRIRVTDNGSLTFEKDFIITVINGNDPPFGLDLSSSSIQENTPFGIQFASFTCQDINGGTFTYSFVDGTGSTDNAEFTLTSNALSMKAVPDHETKDGYTIRVRVTDSGGLYCEKAFIITVTDMPEAPTNIVLSNNNVSENSPSGTTIGTLSGTDQDVGSTFTYSLVSGAGGTDNASFTITGNVLKAAMSFDYEVKSSYSIRLRVIDGTSLWYEKQFTISVEDANDAPTDISLSNSSVAENSAIGTTIGTLSGTDPDSGSTFTYSLVSGTGDTDNASFTISGDTLKLAVVPDFEIKGSYAICIRVSDGSLTFDKQFTITVTDGNDAPTDITLSSNSVAENTTSGSNVAAISATDPNGGSFTYALAAGTGSSDNASFTISGGALQLAFIPDYELKNSYHIRIRATDDGGMYYEEAFIIAITDVNEAPTDIVLSNNKVSENRPSGTAIGTLSGTDPDVGSTFTYSLASGTGDTDNASFTITGNTLQTAAVFDYETKSGYSIRIRILDAGGLWYEKQFSISVEPILVTSITVTSTGGAINVQVGNTLQMLADVSPANATDNSVIWSIASGSGATISAGGLLTATAAGSVIVRATANDSSGVYGERTITITAAPTPDGGGSGGDGSNSSIPSTPTYNAEIESDTFSDTTLPVTVDTDNGSAFVVIGSGNELMAEGKTAVITMPSIPGVDTYTLGIPVPNLSMTDGQGALSFNTDSGSITVTSNMLTGITGISGARAEVTICQGDKTRLPEDIKAAIGDRPMVQLTLSIDGKQTNWNNPDAPVTVSIPYMPTAAELSNPEGIVVWYIDGSGKVVSIPNGQYDQVTGMVTFNATHFSGYAVAYNPAIFNDVAPNAWYGKAVSFISAREITSGSGNGKFSPEAKLTRGEFIVLMMRAYSIAPDKNPADNFSDAGSTYYTGYLAAAKRLGITSGAGNNMYAPDKQITRQEMFTLLYNALKSIGQLTKGDSGKMLLDFTDAGQIDKYAREAMAAFVAAGTIGGNAGKLTPAGTTTRAEMAQVLYNLLGK